MDYDILKETLNRYNTDRLNLKPSRAMQLARLAKSTGEDFNVRSQPLEKGLFDFGDMALFGLLPNTWRPESPGEDIFGETDIDRLSGNIGALTGLVAGGAGLVKGAKYGWGALKGMLARKKSQDIASKLLKGNVMETPVLQLGQGTPLQLGQGPLRIGQGTIALADPRRPNPLLDVYGRNRYPMNLPSISPARGSFGADSFEDALSYNQWLTGGIPTRRIG
tara:strand:- start:5913 stop:6575 length:663 start_codon:yes stop_codon:yes gene_type:complete